MTLTYQHLAQNIFVVVSHRMRELRPPSVSGVDAVTSYNSYGTTVKAL